MNTNDRIPIPPRRWLTRFGLPLLVLATATVLWLSTIWSSIRPARTVHTASALVRDVEVPIETVNHNFTSNDAIVQASGWVEPDPFSVYVGALAEGVVKDIHVLEGDIVTAGQPVATLVDDEARISLRQAKANVRYLHAKLLMTEEELNQVPARIKAAKAGVAELEDEVRRKLPLVEQGAVAAGPVERLTIRLESVQATVEQLEIEQQRLEAAVMTSRAELEIGESEQDEAMLRLTRMTVVSPIDGMVIERLTQPGSVIQFSNGEHASHIVHLYQPEKLQVRTDVPLARAALVRKGQRAEIIVDVLPDQVFEGKITRFVHRADLSKNTVEAKVRVINPSPLLKPDMLARVYILPSVDPETQEGMQRVPRTFVPREAIVGGFVWMIESRTGDIGIARSHSVILGTSEYDGWIEVIEGVRPGDLLILDSNGLKDGDRVISGGENR